MLDRQEIAQLEKIQWQLRLAGWDAGCRRVVGYGAAAKATVWLNWIGDRSIQYVVDSTPEKQGKYIPGVGIQILAPHLSLDFWPADVVIIFCHNYLEEVLAKIPEGPEVWTSMGQRVR